MSAATANGVDARRRAVLFLRDFSPNLLSPPRGRVKSLCPQVCQFGEAIAAFDSQQIGKPHRRGLTISMPAKSFSLSVTTIQSLASAIAAIIVSRALPGLPFAVPSAIRRAQIRPALSSNASTRPSKSEEGASASLTIAESRRVVLEWTPVG